jgi:hypothetical protein
MYPEIMQLVLQHTCYLGPAGSLEFAVRAQDASLLAPEQCLHSTIAGFNMLMSRKVDQLKSGNVVPVTTCKPLGLSGEHHSFRDFVENAPIPLVLPGAPGLMSTPLCNIQSTSSSVINIHSVLSGISGISGTYGAEARNQPGVTPQLPAFL